MLKRFKTVTHVIFDLDGTLLDTERRYEIMISKILARFGKTYTNELKCKIQGTPEPIGAAIIVKEAGLPISPEEYLQEYNELSKTYLLDAPLLPGADKLVRHLHANNIPIAIATSSSRESVDTKLNCHREFLALFNHIVMGSTDPEVKKGKPAPDIFLVCASRFSERPSPEKCLVLEDAPNGVLAAKSAGMQVVMIPDKDISEQLRKPATLVLNSMLEFEPESFGLPPFEE